MLCSTELMQPALVSSTGETEQRGITWGGALTDGFDGGTMPEAPALIGAHVARAVRGNDLAKARTPVRCRLTIPFAPLVPRNWVSEGNVTFRSSDRMSPGY